MKAAAKAPVTTMPVAGRHVRLAAHERPARPSTFPTPTSPTQPVTLELSVEGVTGNDGSAVKSAPAVLGASSVTVPAGATVKVPLKLDPTAKLDAAQYGDVTGRIVATGGVNVSTPFSLYVTPETVTCGPGEGPPRQPGPPGSSVDVIGTDDVRGERRFNDGAADQTFQVRPGTYFLSSFVSTPDPTYLTPGTVDSIAYLGRPEITITAHDRRLRREQGAPAVGQDRPAQRGQATILAFARTWDDTWLHAGSLSAGLTINRRVCRRRGQRQEGTCEFGDWSRRYAPAVESMSVARRAGAAPDRGAERRAGLDGVGTAGLVDGGTGSFFDPARVGGKVVLVKVSTSGISPSLVDPGRALPVPRPCSRTLRLPESGCPSPASRRSASPPTPFRWPRATSSRRSSPPRPVVS